MIIQVDFANFDTKVRKIFLDKNNEYTAVTLGPGSYFVNGNLEFGSLECHVLIGRYSSLGHRLIFEVGLNHDYHQVTAYPFADLIKKDGQNHADSVNRCQVVIGNDVWIGCDVTIMGGVHIGNGAVIGAGAVIAKNVPPYAVVVGNPAKVIKYRFPENIIEKLQKIKWWNWPEDKIKNTIDEMKTPDVFVEKFNPKTNINVLTEAAVELQGLRQDGYEIFCFAVDFSDKKPVWEKVISQYLNKYTLADKKALLLEVSPKDMESKEMQEIYLMLQQAGENAPLIMSHNTKDEIPVDVLSSIDIFITNKEDISSQYIDYATDYGVELLFGTDAIIFKDKMVSIV